MLYQVQNRGFLVSWQRMPHLAFSVQSCDNISSCHPVYPRKGSFQVRCDIPQHPQKHPYRAYLLVSSAVLCPGNVGKPSVRPPALENLHERIAGWQKSRRSPPQEPSSYLLKHLVRRSQKPPSQRDQASSHSEGIRAPPSPILRIPLPKKVHFPTW